MKQPVGKGENNKCKAHKGEMKEGQNVFLQVFVQHCIVCGGMQSVASGLLVLVSDERE